MSDDPLSGDPNWSAVARFLEGRIAPGQRVTGPTAFARVTGPLATPHPAVLPDWAIVHKGQVEDYPQAALRLIMAHATPVFANDVFVVFARQPSFGLRSQRGSVHVNALMERLGVSDDGPASAPPPAPAPVLPPEAQALLRPAAPEPQVPPMVAAAPAHGGLPRRVAAMLADGPIRRAAEIGATGLVAALNADGAADGATDAVVLRLGGPGDLDGGLDAARRLLARDGRLLVVADHGNSLGRRLARAAGRSAPEGYQISDLLGALRASGFRPARAEGFSLDPWRATADEPPADQEAGTQGGDILEVAGFDAGPEHAALLLVVATTA